VGPSGITRVAPPDRPNIDPTGFERATKVLPDIARRSANDDVIHGAHRTVSSSRAVTLAINFATSPTKLLATGRRASLTVFATTGARPSTNARVRACPGDESVTQCRVTPI